MSCLAGSRRDGQRGARRCDIPGFWMDEPGWIIQAAVGQGLTVAKLSVDTEESLRGGRALCSCLLFIFVRSEFTQG